MYATIISGRVQYYGGDFQQACRAFADRVSLERAQLVTVNSATEAEEMASWMLNVMPNTTEDEVENAAAEFSDNIVEACECLLDSLENMKAEDVVDKVQKNVEEVTQRVKRFGVDVSKVIGEGLEKLGRGIKEASK